MKFIDKIKWRIEFLFKKSKNKNLKLIVWNLLPSRSQWAEKIILREVQKCPLIQVEKLGKNDLVFDLGLMKLIYPKNLKISHFAGDYIGLIYPYLENLNRKKNNLLDFFPEHEGPYEKGEVELKKGDWIIDAGANIGMFSILASKKSG